jgi:response regulator NasT
MPITLNGQAAAPSRDGQATRKALRILAVTADADDREFYEQRLPALGHTPCVAGGGRQALDLCRTVPPDILIADAKLPDMCGFELAAAICRERPLPVVLACTEPDAAAVWAAADAHVFGYLAKPLRIDAMAAALAVAVRCFDRVRAQEEEILQLRQSLEDRKVIERAKGAIVRRCKLDEAAAYSRLRRLASNHNRKLAEVARQILAAEDVFAVLEGTEP